MKCKCCGVDKSGAFCSCQICMVCNQKYGHDKANEIAKEREKINGEKRNT